MQDSYDTTEDGRCIGLTTGRIRRYCGEWRFAAANGLCGTGGDPATNGINRLTVEDFSIIGGRVCVASENSGLGQFFTLRRGSIIGDSSLSKSSSGNAVSDPTTGGILGVVHRGGTLTMQDVDIAIKGQATPPRAVCFTDHGGKGDGPAGNARLGARSRAVQRHAQRRGELVRPRPRDGLDAEHARRDGCCPLAAELVTRVCGGVGRCRSQPRRSYLDLDSDALDDSGNGNNWTNNNGGNFQWYQCRFFSGYTRI